MLLLVMYLPTHSERVFLQFQRVIPASMSSHFIVVQLEMKSFSLALNLNTVFSPIVVVGSLRKSLHANPMESDVE